MVKIFSRYDLPESSGVVFTKPSLTQQHFEPECNINNIIAKYASGLTNITPETVRNIIDQTTPPEKFATRRQPQFGDFYSAPDYQTAQNIINDANDAFSALPSYLRLKFGNDPIKFLQWLGDESNRDEAVKLGLVVPKSAAEPTVPDAPAPEEKK